LVLNGGKDLGFWVGNGIFEREKQTRQSLVMQIIYKMMGESLLVILKN